MNQSIEFANSCTELIVILSYLEKDLFNKIPKNIVENIQKYSNKDYKFEYDSSKELKNQKILSRTKNILSAIYIEYCCDEEKKKRMLEKCRLNQEKLNELYSYDKLFKNSRSKEKLQKENTENKSKETMVTKEEIGLVNVKNNESIFRKFLNKIKQIFSIKKQK